MRTISWAKAVLSGIIGTVIGVVFVAIANLASPIANLAQVLIVVCVPAFISAVVGNVIAARHGKST
jgi:hypothetical protein